MSIPNVTYKTELPVNRRTTLDNIAKLVLNSGNNGFLMSIIYGRNPVFVTGSYVYKYLLRNEDVYDVDALSTDNNRLLKTIMTTDDTAYNPCVPISYRSLKTDYNVINFRNNTNVHIDLIGIPDFIKRVNDTGLSLANSLVLTSDGIRHIFEIPEISDGLKLEAKDPKLEREWAIKNIREKKYCKWQGMRNKDIEYFKNWTVIDFQECSSHGIFAKN